MNIVDKKDKENPEWKKYESKIFRDFKRKYKHCDIKINDKVNGKFSKVLRQIDISIKQKVSSYPVLGIVECKYFNKNVNVKIVDSFVGFLEDVDANFGIIITNKGFTTGAANRAINKKIQLDIVQYSQLEKYLFNQNLCHHCLQCLDELVEIEWDLSLDYNEDISDNAFLGVCPLCRTVYLDCLDCGMLIEVNNPIIKCPGKCGRTFILGNSKKQSGKKIIKIN